VAQLNADLARKLQILFPYSADIPIRHNFLLQHIFSGITLYRYTILLLTCSPCFRHVSCFR
jgi:hypothetical protein